MSLEPEAPAPGYVTVCELEELQAGRGKRLQVGDRWLAVFLVDGTVYAIDDLCPHSGGPLSEGTVDGRRVICSWHYATFDLASGERLDSISRYDVDTYPVVVRDGRVWVKPEESVGEGPVGGDARTVDDETSERTT